MTRYDPRRWHHQAAQWLQIKPSEALALIRGRRFPSREQIMPNRELTDGERHWGWRPLLAALVKARTQLDTPVEPFVAALRSLAEQLLSGRPELPAKQGLAMFKYHDYAEHGGGAYPVTQHGDIWRGHRVPVTRAELDAAGYPQFAESIGIYRPNSRYAERDPRERDPYNLVPMGGEVPIGDFMYLGRGHGVPPWYRCHLAERAAFLARLATILDSRDPLL